MTAINLQELVLKNRSYRRFDGKARVPAATLRSLVGLARLAPTGGNMQPLRFRMINRPADCAAVFPHLAWAGYLKDWPGPAPAERPTAYIIILVDQRIKPAAETDVGIAAQTLMLGAVEAGLGGCMIGSVARGNLHKTLRFPEHLHIALVLALGKPAETIRIERIRKDAIQYWRDAAGIHHVPKRSMQELIV